jgi:hypothetical protein
VIQIIFRLPKYLGQKLGEKCKVRRGNDRFEGTTEEQNQLETS